jgi:hypothetical protein
MSIAPFNQARVDYEGTLLYHLPPVLHRMEQPKPVYLIGTRGTGKTTLLKALEWRERLHNESLQRQLKLRGDAGRFDERYVGVYFKLPKAQTYLIDRLLPLGLESDDAGDRLYTDFLAFYFGITWLELLADATDGLIQALVIDVAPEAEVQAIELIHAEYRDYEAVASYLDPKTCRTLPLLARGLREARRNFERSMQKRRHHDDIVNELTERFPIERLGKFAQFTAEVLQQLYPDDEHRKWSFRVCMDEGEWLTKRQQRAFNTMIRTASWPLLPIVAYVALPQQPTETDSEVQVNKADVDIIVLDDLANKDGEFRTFVQGVADVRIQDVLNDASATVDLTRILGLLDLNALLEDILRRSLDPWAKKLLADAEERRQDTYFTEFPIDDEEQELHPAAPSTAPPIYQTYLVQRLNIAIPSTQVDAAERRRHQQELGKKMVGAYFAICQMVDTKPRYASSNMLLQLCDGCVRDFLWQMHELWVERGTDVAEFISRTIDPQAQNKALTRASEQKMTRIGDYVLTDTTATQRLVEGLATLAAELQRPPKATILADARSLKTPEQGAFLLPGRVLSADPLDSGSEDDALYRLVAAAGVAGYLRMDYAKDSSWKFRVHTSLAAHFGFSYRGAYYDTRLETGDIDRLRKADGVAERASAVATILTRLTARAGGARTLFEDDAE